MDETGNYVKQLNIKNERHGVSQSQPYLQQVVYRSFNLCLFFKFVRIIVSKLELCFRNNTRDHVWLLLLTDVGLLVWQKRNPVLDIYMAAGMATVTTSFNQIIAWCGAGIDGLLPTQPSCRSIMMLMVLQSTKFILEKCCTYFEGVLKWLLSSGSCMTILLTNKIKVINS